MSALKTIQGYEEWERLFNNAEYGFQQEALLHNWRKVKTLSLEFACFFVHAVNNVSLDWSVRLKALHMLIDTCLDEKGATYHELPQEFRANQPCMEQFCMLFQGEERVSMYMRHLRHRRQSVCAFLNETVAQIIARERLTARERLPVSVEDLIKPMHCVDMLHTLPNLYREPVVHTPTKDVCDALCNFTLQEEPCALVRRTEDGRRLRATRSRPQSIGEAILRGSKAAIVFLQLEAIRTYYESRDKQRSFNLLAEMWKRIEAMDLDAACNRYEALLNRQR